MSELIFDYIIIGAGTAGCLLANRLSADASKRVLLIEAGRKDDYHWIHIPLASHYCIGNARTDWQLSTEADAGLNGRHLQYPLAKVLGGGSSINHMIYMRGQARDYDQWAQLTGDDTWTWKNVLPYFKLHENHSKGANEWHGAKGVVSELLQTNQSAYQKIMRQRQVGGEWCVEKQTTRWEILDAFATAAQQIGIPATSDFNCGDNEGVGYFDVNQKKGWRWNAAEAFVRPTCYARPNFEMWNSALVDKLIFDDPIAGRPLSCIGVRVWDGREMVSVQCTGELVLSAGSIGTPQILQRSGVGPQEYLQQKGVEVVHDLPGVGANLQDHLQITSVYQLNSPAGKKVSINTLANSMFGKARMAWDFAIKQKGALSMVPAPMGAVTRSSPDMLHPNIEFRVHPMSVESAGSKLHSFAAFTVNVCNLNPSSQGTVQIKSNSFEDAPKITTNYLSTSQDWEVAENSLRLTQRIVSQSAFTKFQPEEYCHSARLKSATNIDNKIAQAVSEKANSSFHPVGTAKMGARDDKQAVVDSRLRLMGINGLRVVDASVMPQIISGDINSAILMMAEKASEWIVEEKHRK